MSRQNKNIDKDELIRYLKDELDNVDRHRIEKSVLEDDFSAEALEGLEQLSSDEIETDLAHLSKRMKNQAKKKTVSFAPLKIAAAILIALGITLVIFRFGTNEIENQLSDQIEDSKSDTPLTKEAPSSSTDTLLVSQNFEKPEKDVPPEVETENSNFEKESAIPEL